MTECNINRILVPVDFSQASLNALNTAVIMARRHNATILLLNVTETRAGSEFPGEAYASREAAPDIIQKPGEELTSLQQSVKEGFLVPCEAIATAGSVTSAITRISSDHKADLIVMGSHGSSGFREHLMGSNAYNVVKSTDCPVLTVPAQKKWETFKKILFPVRAIPSALEKYDFIREIVRKNNATLKILGLATNYEKDVALLKELSAKLNEKLQYDEVEGSTYFKVGQNMADEVLKIAALMETDLIVITATIDATFRQFFMGPYTQYIINRAAYPVLSIRPSRGEAQEGEGAHHTRESFAQQLQHHN